jgi:hypothetical protein
MIRMDRLVSGGLDSPGKEDEEIGELMELVIK